MEKSMEEALDMVMVGDEIRDALTKGQGPYATLYDFMEQYENANWQEVSRQLLLVDVSIDYIHDAYVNALKWYKQLV